MSLRAVVGSVAFSAVVCLGCGERASAPASAQSNAGSVASVVVPAVAAAPAVPAGPQSQWTLAFAEQPSRVTMADDGTVLARVGGELVAARAGAIAWRVGEELREVFAVLGDVVVVARPDRELRRDRLVMLALADGRELGAVNLPADGEPDEFADPIQVAILAPMGDAMLVGDSGARWFRLAPGRCKGGSCLRAAGRLPDETFDSDAYLSFGADGRRLLREGSLVRVFDAEWKTLLTARSHETLVGDAVLGPDGLALIIDDDVVLLAVDACGGEEFAPSGWPQPHRLYARELDECPGCAGPPPGCRRWRSYQEGVHNHPPALLDGGVVVVHIDGETRALRGGREIWTTRTGGAGEVLRIGERLIGVSVGLEDDDPPALYALDLDGRPQWRTPLAMKGPNVAFFTSDVILAAAGASLVAGYEENIAVFARP
ncbi:outer membrane protein assembly factor BamB family protein [Nannocystis radixulma]|uniref:PQQ-binding-like beta-propeller repeat protein n=1 Tax=Nannocystis radixulma TaxID=2995305 RepID=A0ABT5B372_9BACT|nr:PQQ-binding-like beta-propeller repeat protein [Nannocystis radixulma]MDC0668547.1 PQQ-binding-like beta-propeller repeat protein [Nannocystis radixulma]